LREASKRQIHTLLIISSRGIIKYVDAMSGALSTLFRKPKAFLRFKHLHSFTFNHLKDKQPAARVLCIENLKFFRGII